MTGKATTPGTLEIFPKDDLKISCPLLFLSLQFSNKTIMNAEFTCLLLFPKPGTLKSNRLISPFPISGKNILSICSAFEAV